MRYLIFMAAFCFPNVSFAASYLCLPEVTVGWINSGNPNDIRIIEPQNKWLLQPIEPQTMPVTWQDEEIEVNYSLTLLGDEKPYGFCKVVNEVWNSCFEFFYPSGEDNSSIHNKLGDYNEFRFAKDDDASWAYAWADKGAQIFYGIDGVGTYFDQPRVAFERGTCDAF